MSDDQRAEAYMMKVEEQFPGSKGINYLYMDALYERNEDAEKDAFELALSKLWKLIEVSPNLSTDHVQKIETENAMLKRKIMELEFELFKVYEIFGVASKKTPGEQLGLLLEMLLKLRLRSLFREVLENMVRRLIRKLQRRRLQKILMKNESEDASASFLQNSSSQLHEKFLVPTTCRIPFSSYMKNSTSQQHANS